MNHHYYKVKLKFNMTMDPDPILTTKNHRRHHSPVPCSSIYTLTALFGALLFGESTLGDVLANFDTDLDIPYNHLLNDIVRISFALHLMLVFPVILFSLRFNLNDLVFPSATSLESDNCRFSLITTGLISLLYITANFVPSIRDVFQLTGATATVCLGFIFLPQLL